MSAKDPPWRVHLRPSLAGLEVYDVPPSTAPARLHANECPEVWPPEVMQAVATAIASLELNRYPDTSGRRLRSVIAKQHDCDADRVVLGNGSDEIISVILTALSGGPGHMVIPVPTFVMYGHSARVLSVPVREVSLDGDLRLDAAAMRKALPGAAVCFLARPNNPTSSLWDAGLIGGLIEEFPSTVFVIDEAYAAYSPGRSLWGPRNPVNQVHMSTLSKVGLAAIRVGYCIADPALAHAMNKVRHPYNVSATSLAIAETILTRFGDVQDRMIARTLESRTRLAARLAQISDAHVFPAHGNMVLVRLDPPGRASALCRSLAAHGVLVKDVSKISGLDGCLRISAGTVEEHETLARALDALA